MKAPPGVEGKRDPRRPRAIGLLVRSGRTGVEPAVRGIKRKKETGGKRETDTRHGKVEEKGRRGGRDQRHRGDRGERAGPCRGLRRSRTPVPTQHGTASHNRWKGNGGERRAHTAAGEDARRTKERKRDGQTDGGRDPHSTPSLPTRTLLYALRDPRGGEHRDYRLPPTFSRLSRYLSRRLFTPPTSLSRALAPIHLVYAPAPNLSFLSLPPGFLRASLLPLSPPTPFACHPPPPPPATPAVPSLHFRFNVGANSRRANAADKRVFAPRR